MMADEARLRLYYHSAQQRIFDSPAKVKVVAKGRRFGYTRGCANYVIERMLDGCALVLWVDTINTNIDRYVERYFVPVLRQLPAQHWQWRQQKKELTILDRKCDFRSADQPERIEGFAYNLVVLNEAGIILDDPYLWENTIRPMTLDFKPEQIIGGTPKGKNVFFDLATKAQDRQDARYADWEYFHFTSYDNPYIDKAEIAKLAEDLPELVRRQEIEGEFLDDATGVFRNLDAAIGRSVEEGPQEQVEYFMGVDLAKHVDFTVMVMLDKDGRQVNWKRINKLDWPYQKTLIAQVANAYHASVLVDSTGVGDPIYDDLRKFGLNIVGYKFTHESKKQLIEALMLSFEHGELALLAEPIQANELKMFGFEITGSGIKYSAPEGKHDDCVMALALANWARKTRHDMRIHWL